MGVLYDYFRRQVWRGVPSPPMTGRTAGAACEPCEAGRPCGLAVNRTPGWDSDNGFPTNYQCKCLIAG
jgi:hypothetical protein